MRPMLVNRPGNPRHGNSSPPPRIRAAGPGPSSRSVRMESSAIRALPVIQPPVDHNYEQGLSEPSPLRDDTKFAVNKIAIFQYIAVAVFLFLISGFWKLQVQNPEFYDERALANSVKSVPMLAPRGRILDRDGRVIVDNHTSYTLLLAREMLKEEHLAAIAQGLDLDYDDLRDNVGRFRKRPKYVPVPLKQELSPADLALDRQS